MSIDEIRKPKSFDELPPELHDGGEVYSLRILERKHRQMIDIIKALLEYIDAIPGESTSCFYSADKAIRQDAANYAVDYIPDWRGCSA